jgi:hypothetical protein
MICFEIYKYFKMPNESIKEGDTFLLSHYHVLEYRRFVYAPGDRVFPFSGKTTLVTEPAAMYRPRCLKHLS